MRPCLSGIVESKSQSIISEEKRGAVWIAYQTKDGVVLLTVVVVITILLQLAVIANDDESIAPILHQFF